MWHTSPENPRGVSLSPAGNIKTQNRQTRAQILKDKCINERLVRGHPCFTDRSEGAPLPLVRIMPNHAHYILSTGEGKNLSDIMRDFGTHTSREITYALNSEGKEWFLQAFRDAALQDRRGNEFKVWQEGFHPIAIMSERFFRQKLDYLHDNPVRKGYVEKPEHWRYSSARNYILGDHSIIPVEIL